MSGEDTPLMLIQRQLIYLAIDIEKNKKYDYNTVCKYYENIKEIIMKENNIEN